jgi:hypothetical protein
MVHWMCDRTIFTEYNRTGYILQVAQAATPRRGQSEHRCANINGWLDDDWRSRFKELVRVASVCTIIMAISRGCHFLEPRCLAER